MKIVLCISTVLWEPTISKGNIYFAEEENTLHYVINGTGFYKRRFIELTNKPITKLLCLNT